jgi:hypothetical protein
MELLRMSGRVEELEGMVEALRENAISSSSSSETHEKPNESESTHQKEVSSLRKRLEEALLESAAKDERVRKVEEGRGFGKAEVKELKDRNVALEGMMERCKREKSDLVDRNVSLEGSLQRVKREKADLVERNVSLEGSLERLMVEKKALTDRNLALESLIESLSVRTQKTDTTNSIERTLDESHIGEIELYKEKIARLEADISKMRLAQTDIGTLLLQGRDAVSTDLVRALQGKCETLADELVRVHSESDSYKNQIGMRKYTLIKFILTHFFKTHVESLKMKVFENNQSSLRAKELESEVTRLSALHERDTTTWALKERAISLEMERLTRQVHGHLQEMTQVRNLILKSPLNEGSAGKDVEVGPWVSWMIDSYLKLKDEISEAHAIIDIQVISSHILFFSC